MTDTASQKSNAQTNGGQVAIRGFLVQTLVALLDVAQSDFTTITLEPPIGDDQFDFHWVNALGMQHAVQVKSTANSFTNTDVTRWAKKLEAAAHHGEQCRLMLVGNIPPGVQATKQVGAVSIETHNLNLDALVEQAAHRLAKFLESENKPSGTATERERIADALTAKLLHYSASSKPLTRPEFTDLLLAWIATAPQAFKLNHDHFNVAQYAPAVLLGREGETQTLNDAWNAAIQDQTPRLRVLTVVALGGEGKTSLVAKWANTLASENWRGASAVFAWSFYSQGTREQSSASSDLFLKEALVFFGEEALANSAQNAYEKAKQLARRIAEEKALLILDGLEPLQYPPASSEVGKLRDHGIATLLKDLARHSSGLCVVTTRYPLPELNTFMPATVHEIRLPRLPLAAGVQLLKSYEVKGQTTELEKLVEDVKGHALTLSLLGSYLRDAYAGDIRKRDLIALDEADDEVQGGHAFRVMDAYVNWFASGGSDPAQQKKARQALALWRLMGLFDRPAPADCLAELFKSPAIPDLTDDLMGLKEAQRNLRLSDLAKANLLTTNYDAAGELLSVDAHPLIREYFAQKLRNEQSGAWQNAHRRIYKHLCKTQEGEQPTLAQLQPLFAAVAHGCAAGLHQEVMDKVYWPRIQRKGKNYLCQQLGAFSDDLATVAHFFTTPWDTPAAGLTEEVKPFVLNWAGFRLRALGRLREARELMQVGMERQVNNKDWKNAASAASNLSELHLTLGEMAQALANSKRSVDYADQSGDMFMRTFTCTTHADALHQAGHTAAALALFREAEQLQQERQPAFPRLYSLWGFRYCDLLLAQGNTEAVLERVEQWVKWRLDGDSLLGRSLEYLTLGRAHLVGASRAGDDVGENRVQGTRLQQAGEWLEQAVAGLRAAGTQHHLPRGLLAHAEFYRHCGDAARAQQDLQEVLEIAEPSGMRLHLTDYHLESARLAYQDNQPDLARDHTAQAAELIAATGYHRRDAELAALQARAASLLHGG